MNNLTNRRKKSRFQPKVKTVAECQNSKHGLITDISLDGLSFKYYDFGFENKIKTNDLLRVLMVSHSYDFIAENLPCNIVNDFSLLSEVEGFSIEMRKCCLQFAALAPSQKAHLEYFINNFTSEKMTQRLEKSNGANEGNLLVPA